MKHRLIATAFALCLLFSVTLPFISVGRASADQQSDIQNATFKFQDRANIIADMGSFGQVDFVDKDINDGNNNYAPASGNFCDTHGIDLHSGTLNWYAPSIYGDRVEVGYKVGQNCKKVTRTFVTITNPTDPNTGQPAAAAKFQWDSDNITSLNGQESVATFFPLTNAPGVFMETSDHNSECGAYSAFFVDPGSSQNQGTLYIFDYTNDNYNSIPGVLNNLPSPPLTTRPASAYSTIAPYIQSGCNVLSGSLHPATQPIAGQHGTPAAPSPGGGGGGGGGATGPSLGCSVGISFSVSGIINAVNPLNWLFCGITEGLVGVVSWLDTQINTQLAIGTSSSSSDQPNTIFSGTSGCASGGACDDYYKAWQSFRDLALGLIVIAGLIMVVAQALGMEILDAYTIRKVLPRLLIAAVGVAISWELMDFFVTLSNDLGYGLSNLISSQFTDIHAVLHLNFGQSVGVAILGLIGLGIAGLFGLMTFVGTAALALLVAYLVIVLRQIVVILLAILSPIALVAYILPNTQRVYKLWWDTFIKALLMFPMITLLLTTGSVFSAIAVKQGGGDLQYQVIGFVAYFAPYFMIPMTFRFAGAAMSGLGGFINNTARPGFQALRGIRSNQAKQNLAAFKSGTRFEGKRWIPGSITAANAINEASKGLGTGWKGRFGLGERGALARRFVDQAAQAEAAKRPGLQAIKGKNDYNRILAMGMGDERRGRELLAKHLAEETGDDGKALYTPEQIQQRVNTAAKAAHAAGGFTKADGIAAMYNMARDGTAIRDVDDLANLAAIAGQGDNNNTLTFAAEAASISRQVGRPDLAAATEPIAALAYAKSDLMYGKGLYHGDSAKARADMEDLSYAAWKSGSGGEVAWTKFGSAKGRAVRNDTRKAVDILKQHKADIDAGRAPTHSTAQVQDAAAMLVESQKAINEGVGKLNNRRDAATEMGKDGGALNWYLDTATEVQEPVHTGNNPDGTPIYQTNKRQTTQREVIQKIVGDRYAGMSDEQKKAMMERGAKEQEQG